MATWRSVMKRLPTLTHLQFLFLNLIGDGRRAVDIRAGLADFVEAKSSPLSRSTFSAAFPSDI